MARRRAGESSERQSVFEFARESPPSLERDGLERSSAEAPTVADRRGVGAGGARLVEGYYESNFRRILDTVVARYGDLLSPAEWSLAERFKAAPLATRRLYVRLISRRGPSFRRDRLDYRELGDLDSILADGFDQGLFDRAGDASLSERLGLLLRAELVDLLKSLSGLPWRTVTSLRRGELLATLHEIVPAEAIEAALAERFDWVRPTGVAEVLAYRLLFFGNLHQDWTELLLRDLGVVRWEGYEVRAEHRLFDCRQAIDDSLELRLARRGVRELLECGEVEPAVALGRQVLDGLPERHPIARPWADRILVKIGRTLERRGDLDEALSWLAPAERPPARERRARILARLDRPRAALELAHQMVAAPRDETEAAFAPRFAHQMARRLGETEAPWRRPQRPRRRLELPSFAPSSDPAATEPRRPRIEQRVLEHFAAQGRAGLHSENWLWRCLFGLAFWDIVFAPVPGAFQHPFQLGPLDLGEPAFRRARGEAIDARLAALRAEDDLRPRLWPIVEAKRGIANALVPWHEELDAALDLVLGVLRGAALAAVCDRLSREFDRHRRGLPDLFVLAPEEPAGFELIEVKGPGDQLRPEQGAWIDALLAAEIPVHVLDVRWVGETGGLDQSVRGSGSAPDGLC